MFEYKGEYYTIEELETKFGIVQHDNSWMKGTINVTDDVQLHEKGELVDFITDELQFSINHPVNIVP